MLKQINIFLLNKPRSLILAMGFSLILLIDFLDYISLEEFQVDLFYLIPLSLIAWFASTRWAIAASAIATLAWVSHRITIISIPIFVDIWNVFIEFGFFLVFIEVLAVLKREHFRLIELAHEDPLTKIANSRFFYTAVEAEINRNRRFLRPFSIAYIDLDNFKTVNDTMGHNAGDTVLIETATSMFQNIRKTDTVARLGGDEFAILFPETDTENAKHILKKISGILTELNNKHHWPITFSIGVVTFYSPPPSTEEVIGIADKLMYTVKNQGKNSVAFASWP